MRDASTDRTLASESWPGAGGLSYVYLVFLIYLFVEPLTDGATPIEWTVTLASVGVFLPLYFLQFRNPTQRQARAVLLNLGIAALGFAVIPINQGASTYVVYAAAGSGYVMAPRVAVPYLGILAAGIVVEGFGLGLRNPWWMIVPIVVLIGTVGGTNVFQAQRIRHHQTLRRAEEDLEEMAKVAERERIARDLHDVLGHTLSVITLKAELASKLAVTDVGRAIAEIRDVEQVSRQALSDVRRTIEGYQQLGFAGELRGAERALSAAGVRLETDTAGVSLPPRIETVLALALREAVTNVIRHARATRCLVELRAQRDTVTLVVEDDGVGQNGAEGNELAGMRSRTAAIGGTLQIDGSRGVRLTVRVPLNAGVPA
jgi:two-component system sensor histidine kinase DesK